MSRERVAHPADVRRWVDYMSATEPTYKSADWRAWKKEHDRARSMLAGYGLDANGQPVKAVGT